ncbi:hypothetical protein EJ04DRAFT_567360 [Polyplosphaeria fusca]|uniref:Uncharacterized protein n=1 Tax=Polyplosphaeria fusca TaxID=682080 RepID=A0A9P4UXY7_9PLEO|nr:hypothetical protein EJ04DRAFT_567360 [Polyplosphaeria fusca]
MLPLSFPGFLCSHSYLPPQNNYDSLPSLCIIDALHQGLGFSNLGILGDCGKFEVSSAEEKNGNRPDGYGFMQCESAEEASVPKAIELTGQKLNELTEVEKSHASKA